MALLLIMATSSIYVIYGLLRENKGRKRIHGMFGQYVPVEHINKLIDNPMQISTDGEKREMTVLFSDIRDFTSLSEPLTTRELKTFLNHYLTPITKIIFDYDGTIDKYVGDMVMAFWGAPIDDPEHAQQAVKSALDMQKKIVELQDEFTHIGIESVAAGIGIHTGEMNVGDMGSDYRRAYTVLGDAVNLGSRLESLTKFYGVKILVSEDTKKQCHDIVFRYVDNVRVKGKQDEIKIYEPITLKETITTSITRRLDIHRQSFENYLQGDWQQAAELFNQQFNESQEILYQLYLDRIESFSGKPPPGWDTVYKHQSK
jgi:adenylate cyclase